MVLMACSTNRYSTTEGNGLRALKPHSSRHKPLNTAACTLHTNLAAQHTGNGTPAQAAHQHRNLRDGRVVKAAQTVFTPETRS